MKTKNQRYFQLKAKGVTSGIEMAITNSLIWDIWIVKSHEFNFVEFLLPATVTKQITWSKFSDRRVKRAKKKSTLWNHQLMLLSVQTEVSFRFQSIIIVIFDEKVSFRSHQALKCVWFFFCGPSAFSHTPSNDSKN